jgi:hypothetical protein
LSTVWLTICYSLLNASVGSMRTNRDNFSKTVISSLERRVNGHCSNPECKVPTSGPNLGRNTASCIGVAAHLAAAAPGGPRYDENQTVEERKSIENAIWLCTNCATRIDRDDKRFTLEILRQWKRQAEQDAFDELGRPPVSRKSYEALKAVVLGDLSKNSIVSAVQEICKLSESQLESIDPRFSVGVEYKDKKTVYKLNAQQDIECSFSVSGKIAEDFLKKYSELVDHGTALEIDMEAVSLAGSPLFDLHKGSTGKLVFESTKKVAAVCKVSIESGEQRIALDDIRGTISGGRRSITFSGDAFEGFLSLELIVSLETTRGNSSTVTLAHRYSMWNGRSVSKLPYFSRIYNFYEAIAQRRLVYISLEIDGEQVISGESKDIIKESEAKEIFSILRYIRNVRGVVNFIGLDSVFNEGMKIAQREAEELEGLYNLVVDLPKLKGKDIGCISLRLEPGASFSEENSSLMSGEIKPVHIMQEFSSPLNLFGTLTKVPEFAISFSAMKLISSLQSENGVIELILEPDVECQCQVYVVGGLSNA